ncbi:hypothetical protein PF002_g27777 [Phytophthora fragariae]|uniref:Catalase immune-responsive domain-containing protein n=1 Tax=Phytophthora fragariae TaxID=53985 RepID=A0A6A3WBY9_9STRA|nr:hypothetical protein PF002_g27777 [Phytophthora fragariae]
MLWLSVSVTHEFLTLFRINQVIKFRRHVQALQCGRARTTLRYYAYRADHSLVDKYSTRDDNYSQVGDFYRKMLDTAARERLTSNLARSLVNAPKPMQTRAIANFTKCDPHYGRRVQEKVAALTQQKKRTASPAKLNPPRKSFVAAPPSDHMAPRL